MKDICDHISSECFLQTPIFEKNVSMAVAIFEATETAASAVFTSVASVKTLL